MQDVENRKTLVYVVVAGLALVLAWEPWRRAGSTEAAPEDVGTKLFENLKDPLAAKSMEIVRFDEDTATIRPFKVSQVNGVWSIPSHSNYPADAREHMAAAATALLDIEILGVASKDPGDQELYGVILPDPTKLKPGMVGVGTRVTLKDDKDKTLADLVIGKEDKAGEHASGLRFVRRADRDQVYRVKLQTDKLSTKFEDWIEKDLLKLNAFDVRQVELNDYSLEEGVTAQGGIGLRMHPRSKMKLDFDDGKNAWTLADMSEFDQQGQPVAAKLADDEELNAEKLNALKTALDDLQIVDVERKPKGLSQDLKASEEFVKDNEARASLITRGFYPVPVQDSMEIFSSEGEATCTTKDGIKYILRFGNLAGGEESKEDKESGKESKNPALNRFLFVMAKFEPDMIPKPKLDPLPGEAKPEDAKPAEPAADKPATPAAENPAPENKTAAVEQEPAEPAKTEEKPAEAKADEAKKDDAPAADKPAEKKDAPAATPDELNKLAIEKENKRKQDEYNDLVKKNEEKTKELNDRFADWYFIISDDVYKKIHLGRVDVTKKQGEAKEGEPGALPTDPLQNLQKGIKAE